MEVPLTDNEQKLLLKQYKCPNCQGTKLTEEDEMTETNDVIPTMRYFIKCGTCLTDYTVYLKVRHVTHIATFKNGERVKWQNENLKQVQSKHNELDSSNQERNTLKTNKATPE